jgi:PAS domain S-box-containing protein
LTSVLADQAYAEGLDRLNLPNRMFLLLTSAILFLLFILYVIKKVFALMKAERVKKPDNRDTRMEFMVSTFHELVQKLKEKERELEDLRKKAEDRAQDIESYNENILQSVPSGVVSFDESTRITRMNSSAERILGISSAKYVNMHCDEVFQAPISEIIMKNDYLERGEVYFESPAGKKIWLGLNISPLKNNEGKTIGKIIVFTDLTDLKALESQMKLRENLSNLGEMSAGIAHELRNPMGVIAGYTKILSKQVTGGHRETVQAIEKEIKMMDRIISDFMSFAHPVVINKMPLDIAGMIKDIARSFADVKKGIELIIKTTECSVRADETLMKQAFTNLIQNAVDAIGDYGKLEIQGEKSASMVTVSIIDSGHGISDDIRSKIFLPFYTTKENGTGLGLSIVHKIITAHGGNISFESSPKGTSFRISLPCN